MPQFGMPVEAPTGTLQFILVASQLVPPRAAPRAWSILLGKPPRVECGHLQAPQPRRPLPLANPLGRQIPVLDSLGSTQPPPATMAAKVKSVATPSATLGGTLHESFDSHCALACRLQPGPNQAHAAPRVGGGTIEREQA